MPDWLPLAFGYAVFYAVLWLFLLGAAYIEKRLERTDP